MCYHILKIQRWDSSEPIKTFDSPVTLGQIRSLPELQNIVLLKQPRVSVAPLTKKEFERISQLAIVEGKG